MFILLSALFTFSMFYRSTNAIIAPDLTKALHLNAEKLGILGGAFFYSFALLQFPMGMLLDRIGPRIIITVFSLIGAFGAFIFAFAHSFITAFIGRVLIGAGMASVLMGSLKVFVLKFPQDKFALLSGTIIAIGTLGNILATSPLAYLNSIIGWRQTFIWAGIFNVALSLLVFISLSHNPSNHQIPSSDDSSAHKNIGETIKHLLGDLSFWQIGAIAFFRYGTFVALQGLWLGPYLMDIKGYTPVEAGNILMMVSLGMVAGSPVAGHLVERFHSVKRVILSALSMYVITLIPLTGIWEIQSPLIFSILFFTLGFFSGFGMLTYTHIKGLFPLTMSATAIAGVNFFTMAGGAFFMQLLGSMLEFFVGTGRCYASQAYHYAFFTCIIGMVLSLLFYMFSKSKR